MAHDTFTVSCAAQLRFCFYSLFWMLGNLWLKAMVKSPQQYFSREDFVTRRQHTEWFYLDIGLSARSGMATKEVLTDVGLQAREKEGSQLWIGITLMFSLTWYLWTVCWSYHEKAMWTYRRMILECNRHILIVKKKWLKESHPRTPLT